MVDYLLIILSTVLTAVNFAFTNLYRRSFGTSLAAGLKINAMTGLVYAIVAFLLNGCHVEFTWFSGLLALLSAFFGASYFVLGLTVLKMGSMTTYTVFLMTGGMILPYLFGIFFLNEPWSVLRIIGLVIIFAAVVISNLKDKGSEDKDEEAFKQKKKNKSYTILILLCIAIFVLNGGVSIVSKLHQVADGYETVGSTAFVILMGFIRFVLCSTLLLFVRQQTTKWCKEDFKRAIPIGVASGVVSGMAFLLQLISAKNLPASVLFPIVTGGSIVFSAIFAIIFFKEKQGVKKWVGIALCVIGTCFFL